MLYSKQRFENQKPKFNSTYLVSVSSRWVNDSTNKHSSSKWKKLTIDLFNKGYSIYYRKSGTSVYLYISGEKKCMKVRVSNHCVKIPKNNKQWKTRMVFSNRFGNTSLLIGPGGVSVEDGYYLITETI